MIVAITNKKLKCSFIMMIDINDAQLKNKLYFNHKTGVTYIENGKTKYLSRLIMNCEDGMVVDHISGDRLDNRRKNLRVCTQKQNIKNQSKSKNNTSGFLGVVYDSRKEPLKKRWNAQIKVNYKRINLGRFLTKEDAAKAHDIAAIKYFGEFAKLNFKE